MTPFLDLVAFGVDTIRAKLTVPDSYQPYPVLDRGFQVDMLGLGWRPHTTLDLGADTGELLEATTFAWQDPENDSLRLFLGSAGRVLTVEFSVPRLLTGSALNLALATPGEALEAVNGLRKRSAGNLLPPLAGGSVLALERVQRLDLAADLNAGAAAPGVIASAIQFVKPRARAVSRLTYPGETATVRGTEWTFRAYDKARELSAKLRLAGAKHNFTADDDVRRQLREFAENGRVRLEHSERTKRGITVDDVKNSVIRFADHLETGFNGGIVYIGGLDRIRAQIDAMDAPAQRRSSLIAFAVRYSTLGEDGMRAAYSERTFRRQKQQFLEAGLRLENICTYSGDLDFRPALKLLRAGGGS